MNDETRSTIARAALAVARHIHDGGYEAVIISGGSHQLSQSLVALGWGVLYPDEPIVRQFVLDREGNRLLYKSHAPDAYPTDFTVWADAHVPGLANAKDARLCFVDDFAIGGEKHRGVRAALELLGFADVGYAYFAAKEDTELDDAFVGIRSVEAVAELRHLAERIQGKEDPAEILNDIHPEAVRLRAEALGELRDIGREMRR